MKIHGKTFSEVFDMLPWQHKALVVIGAAFIIFAILHTAMAPFKLDVKNSPTPLVIPKLGDDISVMDPAIDADPAGRRAAMVFTNIFTDGDSKRAEPGIRVAFSPPPCRKWQLSTFKVPAQFSEIYAPDGYSVIATGVWRYETPTIVFDPEDPGREWKIYAYKYLWTEDSNFAAAQRYSVIAHWYTQDPVAGIWSTEEWALSAAPDYPPPPYQSMVQTHINALDPSLAGMTLYARPSVVNANGVLMMSLSAFAGGLHPDRVILLASFDHGRNWRYMGTPLRNTDVAEMKSHARLGGATLIQQSGQVLLAAVLGGEETAGDGTFIFAFEDISKGLLKKDPSTGLPAVISHIPRNSLRPTQVGGGYAGYHDACTWPGMMVSEHSGLKNTFQVFQTFRKPVELEGN